MLQTIRDNSQGIIAKVIVGLIALTFALWGVESLVGLGSKEKAPASVNGEEISAQELFRGVELQRRQILSQMGEAADPTQIDENLLRRMVLEDLIERTLLTQSAAKQGLYLSEEMLDQLIVMTPQFQIDGRFDRNQFEAVLRGAGFTPLMYRELLRMETLIEQEQAAYALSSFVTPSEVERLVALDQQTRDFAFVRFPLLPEMNRVAVSDDEIQALYETRAAQLQAPEKVILEYLLLERDQFVDPDAVSDEEVERLWQQMVAEFQSEEERSASHILIEINSERDALAALAQIQSLHLELEAGASFEDLAREFSDDPGSSAAGGSIGFVTQEMLVGPFADTLFSLEPGQVSTPVETEFGYHLIRLDEVRAMAPPSLAEVAFDLRMEVAERDAERRYVEEIERLADLTFSAADLSLPAEELGIEVQTSEAIARDGTGDPLGRHARVLEAAFSQDVLRERLNSAPIELNRHTTLVVRVKEHLPARALSFTEVRQELEMELLTEKARAQLNTRIQDWKEALRQGQSLEDLTQDYSWTALQGANRGAADVPTDIRNHVFALQLPAEGAAFSQLALADGSQVLVRLEAIHENATELTAEEMRLMQSILGSNQGQQEYQARLQSLRDAARIERN